jgi:integrase
MEIPFAAGPAVLRRACCGLRPPELSGLAWADLDLDRRRIHVRQAQVGRDRRTPVAPGVVEVLGATRNAMKED